MKKHNILIKIALLVISSPFLAVYFAFVISSLIDRNTIIKNENRGAITYKRVEHNFMDGSMQASFEKRMQDQSFGREFFMKVARYIDKLGEKAYYPTFMIDGHTIQYVDNGKRIIVDGIYDFNQYLWTFNDSRFNFNNLSQALDYLENEGKKVLVMPTFRTNLFFQDAFENTTEKLEHDFSEFFLNYKKSHNNFEYSDQTYVHDFDKYKEYALINDHHQTWKYNDLLTGEITKWMGVKRLDEKGIDSGPNKNVFKADTMHRSGSRWSLPGNPHIPHEYFYQKIDKNDYVDISFTTFRNGSFILEKPFENLAKDWFIDQKGNDINIRNHATLNISSTQSEAKLVTNTSINAKELTTVIDSFYMSVHPKLIQSISKIKSIPHWYGNIKKEDFKAVQNIGNNILFSVRSNYATAISIISLWELMTGKR